MSVSVSSASAGMAMRTAMARMQADLNKGQKELNDGRVADVGLALGAGTAQSVSLNRDFDRLNNIVDTNSLATGRLSASQSALDQLGKSANTFLSALTVSLSGNSTGAASVQATAKTTLSTMTALLNTAFNGEYVFGGTNSGSPPFADWSAAGSPARAAFTDAFQQKFGFATTDAQASGISKADMESFLDSVGDQFLGSGWGDNWSAAGDDGIVSRIGVNETAQTSVSANNAGIRKLAFAAAAVAELGDRLGGGGREALFSRAVSLVGESTAGIASLQADAGLLQARVKGASERLEAQTDLISNRIQALESVDPYEASTKVTDLLQQIQTSYALTARIQQLSLAQYLT